MARHIPLPQWAREIVGCPKCGRTLQDLSDRLECAAGHVFGRKAAVAQFAVKEVPDRYDDAGYVERYAQFALGHAIRRGPSRFGTGDSEGLYRTMSEIVLRELVSAGERGDPVVVDVGCGVGRTVHDIASTFPLARVLGFDYSLEMAAFAMELCRGAVVPIGCASDGFPVVYQSREALPNVWIAQADARETPLRARFAGCGGADVVLINMVLDRLGAPSDVEAVLAGAVLACRRGGLVVVSTPFNWISRSCWERFDVSREWLLDAVVAEQCKVESAFDGLLYVEKLDPFGAALQLPVAVVSARRL